jgi:signal peptidase I
VLVAAALAGLLVWRARPFRAVVSGASMEPSLAEGDVVLALAGRTPRTGGVVVVGHPDRAGFDLVKRVAGSPGEVMHLLGNGTRLPEPVPLGSGEWFVVGDAPGASTDSRSFGPVGRGEVRGVVVFVVSPAGRRGRVR